VNADNSEVLCDTFFLKPIVDDACKAGKEFPAPNFKYKPITNSQIEWAIAQLGPYKVPGADGIANVVFMQCMGLLVPHLGLIYRVIFMLKTYPKQWKESNMVVLR